MRSQEFTVAEARKIGDSMSVDWGKYDLEQFRIGLFVELEDGMDDPTTDMTDEEMRLPTVGFANDRTNRARTSSRATRLLYGEVSHVC